MIDLRAHACPTDGRLLRCRSRRWIFPERLPSKESKIHLMSYIYIYSIILIHMNYMIFLLHIYIYMIDVTTLTPSPRHDRPSHRMLGEPNSKPLDPSIQAGGPTLEESTGRFFHGSHDHQTSGEIYPLVNIAIEHHNF